MHNVQDVQFGYHPPTVQNLSSSPPRWRMSVSQIVCLNWGVSRFWVAPCLIWEFYFSHRISTAASNGFRFLHRSTRKEIYFVPPSAPLIELINTHCTKRLDERRDLCLSLGRWLLFVIFKERRKPAVSPNLELPTG
jgi:hypothetical protein